MGNIHTCKAVAVCTLTEAKKLLQTMLENYCEYKRIRITPKESILDLYKQIYKVTYNKDLNINQYTIENFELEMINPNTDFYFYSDWRALEFSYLVNNLCVFKFGYSTEDVFNYEDFISFQKQIGNVPFFLLECDDAFRNGYSEIIDGKLICAEDDDAAYFYLDHYEDPSWIWDGLEEESEWVPDLLAVAAKKPAPDIRNIIQNPIEMLKIRSNDIYSFLDQRRKIADLALWDGWNPGALQPFLDYLNGNKDVDREVFFKLQNTKCNNLKSIGIPLEQLPTQIPSAELEADKNYMEKIATESKLLQSKEKKSGKKGLGKVIKESNSFPNSIPYNMHDSFTIQIPDYFETHFKEEDENLSQYFIARYHPRDNDWEHFAGAEQSFGITRQFHGGHQDADYTNPEIQEFVLTQVKIATTQSQKLLEEMTGGLLKSLYLDAADGCPYIYHAEKDFIIVISERCNDYSMVGAHLQINDGTSYEMSINDHRDVTSDQRKSFLCQLLDSIKPGTDGAIKNGNNSLPSEKQTKIKNNSNNTASKNTEKKKSTKSDNNRNSCPIPKNFSNNSKITDADFTPDGAFAQSAAYYILDSVSKLDKRFSTPLVLSILVDTF